MSREDDQRAAGLTYPAEAMRQANAEVARLRAELADTRAAGEVLDDVLGSLLRERAPIPWALHEDATVARDQWDSVRGSVPVPAPDRAGGDEPLGGACPECGHPGPHHRLELRPDLVECVHQCVTWQIPGLDPDLVAGIAYLADNRRAWKAAAVGHGCSGLPCGKQRDTSAWRCQCPGFVDPKPEGAGGGVTAGQDEPRRLIDTTPPSRSVDPVTRRALADELRTRFPDGPADAWSAGWLSAAGYIASDDPLGVDPGTDLAAPAVDTARGPVMSDIEKLTRAQSANGMDVEWDALTDSMRQALADVVARRSRAAGEQTYVALRRRRLMMGVIATEHGEALVAWARENGRCSGGQR